MHLVASVRTPVAVLTQPYTHYITPPLRNLCLKPCQVMTCLRSGVESTYSKIMFAWQGCGAMTECD